MTFPTANPSVGGGTDFKRLSPGYISATSTGSYTTLLSVTGKGLLVSITQLFPAGAGTGAVRLTIDGVQMFDDTGFSGGSANVSVEFLFAFKRSLLVEHRGTSGTATTKVAYLIG